MMESCDMTSSRSWISSGWCADYRTNQTMCWVVRMRRRVVTGMMGDLTGVRKRVRSIRRIYAVQLARNSVTCRLRMPEWFPAHGNPQAGYTDLTDVDDHRAVRPLCRMVSCPGWMMGMRLMRIMHIIV